MAFCAKVKQKSLSEAEMSHEELLKKYNIQASEFKDQKEEIANIFLSELAKMQQAEGCGPICHFLTRDRRFFKVHTFIVALGP